MHTHLHAHICTYPAYTYIPHTRLYLPISISETIRDSTALGNDFGCTHVSCNPLRPRIVFYKTHRCTNPISSRPVIYQIIYTGPESYGLIQRLRTNRIREFPTDLLVSPPAWPVFNDLSQDHLMIMSQKGMRDMPTTFSY